VTDTASNRWRPLLDGADAERAWTAIRALAEALRPPPEGLDPEADPGLSDGSAGLALFYAYLGAATGEEVWMEQAQTLIEHSIDGLANKPLPAALHGGFTGIGWTIEHLQGMLFEEEDEDDPIGESLLERLQFPAARGDYDLITGLAGYGFYALEALPRPAARRSLQRVTERLAEIGEPAGNGFSWFTPPELIAAWQRADAPNGNFNLGVAHGVPAIVSLLGECAGAGVLSAEGRKMLDGAVAWLLGQKQHGEVWCFASAVTGGVAPAPSRMAWCYGDPGIAAALMTAARHAGQPEWEAEALDIARRAAKRPSEHSGFVDPGICHGSAGLAHLFNRMYQATGDETLAEAARFWYRHTLDLQKPGEGIAGFLFWAPEVPFKPKWEPIPGFLAGAVGVALALLAAVTPQEPKWDRTLAVSVPLGEAAEL